MRAPWPLLLLLVAGCAAPPPCPLSGPGDVALSAGCLVMVHGKILVVENHAGLVGPPGGKREAGESAQCTAHRETWEETGLEALPVDLLHTFDTGFNLYRCELHADSGVLAPHAPTEVRRAYWLPEADFARVNWRFPGQDRELLLLLRRLQHVEGAYSEAP